MSVKKILDTDDLKAITGYQRAGDAARCLREQGVRVFNGRRGPWTTIDLVNQAGGLTPGDHQDELEPRQII